MNFLPYSRIIPIQIGLRLGEQVKVIFLRQHPGQLGRRVGAAIQGEKGRSSTVTRNRNWKFAQMLGTSLTWVVSSHSHALPPRKTDIQLLGGRRAPLGDHLGGLQKKWLRFEIPFDHRDSWNHLGRL